MVNKTKPKEMKDRSALELGVLGGRSELLLPLKERLFELSNDPQTKKDLKLLKSLEKKSRESKKRNPISLVDLTENFEAVNNAVSRDPYEAFGFLGDNWVMGEALNSFQNISDVMPEVRKMAREGYIGYIFQDYHLVRSGIEMSRSFGLDERPDDGFPTRIINYYEKVAKLNFINNNIKRLKEKKDEYTKREVKELKKWIYNISLDVGVDVIKELKEIRKT